MEGATVLDENTLPQTRWTPEMDLPDEEEARSCLEVKVWDDYDDEWTLRTAEIDHLAHGGIQIVSTHIVGRYGILAVKKLTQMTKVMPYNSPCTMKKAIFSLVLQNWEEKRSWSTKVKESQTVFISIQVRLRIRK